MAVNLIRKNNGVGISAYQDAVLFHLAKGENGVIQDVHDEFQASFNSTTKTLSIASGMGILYGRQFEVTPGDFIDFDLSSLTGTRYIIVYAEVDLLDPTSETVSFKSSYATTAYPSIEEGDNLISTPNGIYRYLLYQVLKVDDSVTIAKEFHTLQNDLVNEARNINGIKITHNPTLDTLDVKVPSSLTTDVIERKRLIYYTESPIRMTQKSVSDPEPALGTEIELTENIQAGDLLEIHGFLAHHQSYLTEDSDGPLQVIRAYVGYHFGNSTTTSSNTGYIPRVVMAFNRVSWSLNVNDVREYSVNITVAEFKAETNKLVLLGFSGIKVVNSTFCINKIYKIIGGA